MSVYFICCGFVQMQFPMSNGYCVATDPSSSR